MALQKHNLSFLMFCIIVTIVIPLVPCHGTSQEDPLNNIIDGGTFNNLIQQRTQVLRLKRFVNLGVTSLSSISKFNVNDFGAKGDGKSDDTEAFNKAWQVACSSGGDVILVVPSDYNYLLKPVRFSGPCDSSIAIQISGTLEASENSSDYTQDHQHWLMFESLQKLTVQGGGTVNGNGDTWWQNSCKTNPSLPCQSAPTAVTFYKCEDLIVENLMIKNAQQIHVKIQESTDVKISSVTVNAPEDSPNTDGIHITNTKNIKILNSLIATGDDCLSIESGTQNLLATGITCGPGHGISIGNLGETGTEELVSGITVNGAKLYGTTNGVRIKTWQGGVGSASKIKFQNIMMENVTNPIIIDQNYCDQKTPCEQKSSAVKIKNVLYENIKGTSASEVAVSLNCSQSFPCEGVVLQNIDLQQEGGQIPKASCESALLSYVGSVSPRCP
ncbi:polygalacturonase-like [Prosopis cineraria]|uniref:polygalacturonase-like n=1 Tax=Prosopis cineraria TaxID=364024 RepID=UPI00240F9F8D|nr:polygalacturonase-like [Prosopis cineraria]